MVKISKCETIMHFIIKSHIVYVTENQRLPSNYFKAFIDYISALVPFKISLV